jgi:hypothetical protein
MDAGEYTSERGREDKNEWVARCGVNSVDLMSSVPDARV